jgi:cbb3-type cytochrome oxidase maturation protein
MEALFLLIPLGVAIVAGATWLFLHMADQGQFEDLDSPAHQILMDDDRPAERGRDSAR